MFYYLFSFLNHGCSAIFHTFYYYLKGGIISILPRHSRTKSNTRIYHVVIKGADRQLLFDDDKDYKKYLDILEYYKSECGFEIFAYCLMSNHVHLLIRHPDDCSLDYIFRRINTTYAMWFNMKYSRTGFLQNDRFFSEPVEEERYLLAVVKYIHFNPTKAGLEQSPGTAYPWSSFFEYINQVSQLVDTPFILNILGGIEAFKDFHTTPSDFKCLDINQMRSRTPDDVARDVIREITNCESVTDFQKLSLVNRDLYISQCHQKGISIRQINRLTGIPIGAVQKAIKKSNNIQ